MAPAARQLVLSTQIGKSVQGWSWLCKLQVVQLLSYSANTLWLEATLKLWGLVYINPSIRNCEIKSPMPSHFVSESANMSSRRTIVPVAVGKMNQEQVDVTCLAFTNDWTTMVQMTKCTWKTTNTFMLSSCERSRPSAASPTSSNARTTALRVWPNLAGDQRKLSMACGLVVTGDDWW